jgi:hydrogenase maturation protease
VRALLLGLGNPLLGDDAIGIRLARRFKPRLDDIAGLHVIEDCSLGGLNLLEIVAGFERLIVIDSIQVQGAAAGEWFCFTAACLRDTRHLSSIHDVNFATALELGRRLNLAVAADREIHIFAVAIVENRTFSETLSPDLEKKLPELEAEILPRIREILEKPPLAT